jgi:predicted PurR-regulated permease PerM
MKKFLVIMLAMLWMSVAAFSQITISQEDYDKLPNETRTQIEKITTEKAIKGEIKEVSEYANLGKEIGVAVNETLKAVEDSAIRIAESNLGQTAITGIVVGTILLGISVFMLLTGRGKLSKTMKMLEVG